MQYRKFGKLDWKGSALGFGAMRLPVKDGEYANIDEPEATRMLHYAINHGVNYVDTAYNYHRGNSEQFLGRALKGSYREKIRLATKQFPPEIETADDFDRLLDEQLKRLQTDHVDFYLLHGMNGIWWPRLRDLGVLEWAERTIADGRIGHLGFSFHGTLPLFKEVIEAYDWTMCQIQYNLINEDVQAGTEGLEYAAEKGVAVVIMEPLLGGALVSPPPDVQRIWDEAGREPVDVALRWLWNKPQVSVVLSGMSTLAQVQQNVEIADRSGVGTLTQEELDVVARVQEAYQDLDAIPCTNCQYCMPCPNGVDILRNFELYNQATVYGNESLSKALYNWHTPEGARADACIACGECEEKCPQQIEISEWMPRVHERLAET